MFLFPFGIVVSNFLYVKEIEELNKTFNYWVLLEGELKRNLSIDLDFSLFVGLNHLIVCFFFSIKSGSRDGAVVRAFVSRRCGVGSIPGPSVTCGLSWCLVLVLAQRVFLQILWVSSLRKHQHSKFQFDTETVDKKSHQLECPLLNFPFFFLSICFVQVRKDKKRTSKTNH